MLKYF